MGLGGGWRESDEYEWLDLTDVPDDVAEERPAGRGALASAVLASLTRVRLWDDRPGERLLLVDLDNLRADPVRWRARMEVVARLAQDADHVAIAGQHAAVRRAVPHLGDLADEVVGVDDGGDLADLALLEAAGRVTASPLQVMVVSNDYIFAGLADRGPLVVLSPGADALSERLRDAADRVVDLAELEAGAR